MMFGLALDCVNYNKSNDLTMYHTASFTSLAELMSHGRMREIKAQVNHTQAVTGHRVAARAISQKMKHQAPSDTVKHTSKHIEFGYRY